jgi:hypothetical protein
MSGLRGVFSHLWTRFIGVDTRLKNSAVATIFLSILTGLIVGLPGYFGGDGAQATGSEPNITRALYETRLVEEACHYDRFIALQKKTLLAIEPMTQDPVPANFIAALGAYVDFSRGARPIVADMQKTVQGIVPPREFTEDQQKLEASLQVLQKIVDDLDRSLPTGLNRPAEQVLADPAVIERVLIATRVITGAAYTLGNTTYSDEFNKHFVCPDLNTLTTPAR